MGAVSEHTDEIDGLPVFWRSAPPPAGSPRPMTATPTLYLHGVPSSADDWTPFLERGGGLAVDLPGFGRSGKPVGFDYSIGGYDRFLDRFLDTTGLGRVSMVVHDWGAVGLALAQRRPERIARLVVINAVPLLAGYRWHRVARVWRAPILGELAMGVTNRRVLRRFSRESTAGPGPLPDDFFDAVLEHFDHGTQRAILRLYRNSPEDVLAAAGARLSVIDCPALVLWGERDPYIPACFADAYAAALPGAALERLPDAGHWPWLDRPDLVERIVAFTAGG